MLTLYESRVNDGADRKKVRNLIEHDVECSAETHVLDMPAVGVVAEYTVIEPEDIPKSVVISYLRPYIHATVPVGPAPCLETVSKICTDEEAPARRIVAGKGTDGNGTKIFVAGFREIVRVSGGKAQSPVGSRHKLAFHFRTERYAGLVGQRAYRHPDVDAGFDPGVLWSDFRRSLLGI